MTYNIIHNIRQELENLIYPSSDSEENSYNYPSITTIALGALTCIGMYYYFFLNKTTPALQNAQLTRLNLSNNPFTSPPDVTQNTQLQILYLYNNRLTSSPDVSQNTQLESLDLSYNHLTSPPDVTQNTQLKSLNLSYNHLTSTPDVSQNTQLTYLSLYNNQLTELHDSILSLSSSCEVNVENNLFSAEYIQSFQARLQQHRLEHPGQGPHVLFSIRDTNIVKKTLSLESTLTAWAKEFPEGLSTNLQEHFSSLFALDAQTQQMLAEYLERLRQTKDYQTEGPSKQNVILRVSRMLQLANTNEEFKNSMLALISQGLDTCGDRVLIIFNEIEILWQLYQDLNPEDFQQLASRAQRYHLLTDHAKKVCEIERLGDAIETILYFHIHLKDDLNLPISTKGMLYPRISGVTPEMLEEAKTTISAISKEDLLAGSSYWLEYVERQNPEKVAQINESYNDLLNDLEEYFDSNTKEDFLIKNPSLSNLLDKAKGKEIIFEYSALAKFIDQERQREISQIL